MCIPGVDKSVYGSLIPRPLPAFRYFTQNMGGPGMRNHIRDAIRREKVLRAGQVKGHRISERCRYQRSIGELETLVVEYSMIA